MPVYAVWKIPNVLRGNIAPPETSVKQEAKEIVVMILIARAQMNFAGMKQLLFVLWDTAAKSSKVAQATRTARAEDVFLARRHAAINLIWLRPTAAWHKEDAVLKPRSAADVLVA
jgi:hypothetical protein